MNQSLSPMAFLADLTNPALSFLPRALFMVIICAVVCGVVGCYVVLRGMAFLGDAVAHSVFPGIAVAFALQGSVLVGGALSGLLVAILIALLARRRSVKTDALIGVLFAAAFALGMVVISQVDGYTASLQGFLFGSIAGVSPQDLGVTAAIAGIIVVVLLVFTPGLVAVALDPDTARVMKIQVTLYDVLLYAVVATAVVISVKTVGTILVLALLITPAVCARLLTDSLPRMMALSAGIGALSGVAGLYLSWAWNWPTGAAIVLTCTAVFCVCYVLEPYRARMRRFNLPSSIPTHLTREELPQ